ncbi:MAG: hypothetical protein LBP34_05885, partial [Flavobacteriaceae bacterium]|nr:hypothetical protein [Flavobacteriaceae bacterium]
DTLTDSQGKYEIKVYKNTDGKFSVEFKFKKAGNPKTKDQKQEIEQQVETLMNEKLNELGWEGKYSPETRQSTEDGGEFWVKKMTGKEWLGTLGDLGSSVWENAAMPASYWNKDKGYDKTNIHIPPTFAGVGDGVIDEVTQYPQLIKLGYDVVTKEEVRDGLWESVKGISVETIKDAAVDFYEEKKANYTSNKSYIVNHTVGKDGVQVASILLGTGGLKNVVKNVNEGVDNVGKKVKKAIDTKKADLDEFMRSTDFANIMDNSYRKYKGQLSKADWETRYKTLYKNREIGKLTEEQFQLLEGGMKPKKGITTSDGKRYFDNVLDETAREVKSGPITLSNSKQQILKDIEILNQNLTNNRVSKIEWHCFNNADKKTIEDFIEDNLREDLKGKRLFIVINY